jgi:putative addiction module killer protein
VEVRQYQTVEGKTPRAEWLDGLRDRAQPARVTARLDRLKAGLLGDWKSVGGGICELRIEPVRSRRRFGAYQRQV